MTVAEFEILTDPEQVDWPAVHRLLLNAYAYMSPRIDPPSSLHRMSVADLQIKAQSETLLLAKKASDVVGCMFCRNEGEWLYVGKVAVAELNQGQGIGRCLFDCAFQLARSNKQKGLELESRVELIENHSTFAKLGFVKVGEDSHAGYDRPTSIRMRAAF